MFKGEVKETQVYMEQRNIKINLQMNGNLTFSKVQGRVKPLSFHLKELICMDTGKNCFAFLLVIYYV